MEKNERRQLTVAEGVTDKTRLKVISVLSGQMSSLSDVPQEQVLAVLTEIARAKRIALNFTAEPEEGEVVYADCIDAKYILSPEEIEQLLQRLELRFYEKGALYRRGHVQFHWESFAKALKANPIALWRINEMEKRGHEPSACGSRIKRMGSSEPHIVYVGTCSKKAPNTGLNYEEALSVANEMEAKLMDRGIYTDFQSSSDPMRYAEPADPCDTDTSTWLETPYRFLHDGKAFAGSAVNGKAVIDPIASGDKDKTRGVRCYVELPLTY